MEKRGWFVYGFAFFTALLVIGAQIDVLLPALTSGGGPGLTHLVSRDPWVLLILLPAVVGFAGYRRCRPLVQRTGNRPAEVCKSVAAEHTLLFYTASCVSASYVILLLALINMRQ